MLQLPALPGRSARKNYPPIHKARVVRDAERHRTFSRFVIILDPVSALAQVIDNGDRIAAGQPWLPLIAVLGPADYLGDFFPEAILLEIGYRRTRPYRQTNCGIFPRERMPIRHLTPKQMREVWPVLLQCFEQIVLETRARWTHKGRWFTPPTGHPLIEKGVQFTIHRDDRLAHLQFLREHNRYFKEVFLPRYALWINGQLRGYRYNRYTHYGQKARAVSESLQNSRYFKEPLLLETLLQMVEKPTLLQSILSDLGSYLHTVDDEELELVYWQEPPAAEFSPTLYFYKTLDQPEPGHRKQAQGCKRFEIVLESKYRRSIEGTDGDDYFAPWPPPGGAAGEGNLERTDPDDTLPF